MSFEEPLFLDVDDVIELHGSQLAVHGGSAESAVAQPEASFAGQYVHDGLFAMAAAYLFHLVCNHPFVDGNKRMGLLSALVFLDVNGISIDRPSEALYELTMGVAEGRVAKPAVVAELERIARSKIET